MHKDNSVENTTFSISILWNIICWFVFHLRKCPLEVNVGNIWSIWSVCDVDLINHNCRKSAEKYCRTPEGRHSLKSQASKDNHWNRENLSPVQSRPEKNQDTVDWLLPLPPQIARGRVGPFPPPHPPTPPPVSRWGLPGVPGPPPSSQDLSRGKWTVDTWIRLFLSTPHSLLECWFKWPSTKPKLRSPEFRQTEIQIRQTQRLTSKWHYDSWVVVKSRDEPPHVRPPRETLTQVSGITSPEIHNSQACCKHSRF
jgi:hypothetical protein